VADGRSGTRLSIRRPGDGGSSGSLREIDSAQDGSLPPSKGSVIMSDDSIGVVQERGGAYIASGFWRCCGSTPMLPSRPIAHRR
jgi:hypothetical protein